MKKLLLLLIIATLVVQIIQAQSVYDKMSACFDKECSPQGDAKLDCTYQANRRFLCVSHGCYDDAGNDEEQLKKCIGHTFDNSDCQSQITNNNANSVFDKCMPQFFSSSQKMNFYVFLIATYFFMI